MEIFNSHNQSRSSVFVITERPVIEWFKQQEKSALEQTMPIEISDRFHSMKMKIFFNRFMLYLLMPFLNVVIQMVFFLNGLSAEALPMLSVAMGILFSIFTVEGIVLKTRFRNQTEKYAVKRLVKMLYFETLISVSIVYLLFLTVYLLILLDTIMFMNVNITIHEVFKKINDVLIMFNLSPVKDVTLLIKLVVTSSLLFLLTNFLYVFIRTRGVPDGFDRS